MNDIQKILLEKVADLHEVPQGAYNIRSDGETAMRNVTENIDIVSKKDVQGIDIFIKEGTKNESLHIPVILSKSGLKEIVYNDFHIGDNCDITIIAGCGIHNGGDDSSKHDGIHSFFIGNNSKVRYVEKHYGEGDGKGEKIMNPTTIIDIKDGGFMEMETLQIKGIDSTNRVTKATVSKNGKLVINEKLMTHGNQFARTLFEVEMNGEESSVNLISRSVAKDNSIQEFLSKINGNNSCRGHSECDAIISKSP